MSIDLLSLAEALACLAQAGYENITEEVNRQNGCNAYAAFDDPSGVGVHYCFEEEDVIDLAEATR